MSEEYIQFQGYGGFDLYGGDEVARGMERFFPSDPPTGHNAVPELSIELLKALGLFMAKTALEAKLGKINKRLGRAIEELMNDEYPEYERMATLIEGPIKDCES